MAQAQIFFSFLAIMTLTLMTACEKTPTAVQSPSGLSLAGKPNCALDSNHPSCKEGDENGDSGASTADIVFESDRYGDEEIFAMSANGADPTRLTNSPGRDFLGVLSPDGTRIAFNTERDGNYEIYVMNADGSSPINVTNYPGRDLAPAWSPDGKKLGFYSDRSGGTDIYVMDPNGSNLKNLSNTPELREGYPAWSPDGTRISYRGLLEGPPRVYELYVMNANGTGQTRLTFAPGNDVYSDWSPDGSKIAFDSSRDGNREIYIMNPDGSEQNNLTNNSLGDDLHPTWSPDGKEIVFQSDRDGNTEIYVMNVDGGGQKNLTQSSSSDGHPSWWWPPLAPECDDGIDNDTDGKIDHPEDPDCRNPKDNSEG